MKPRPIANPPNRYAATEVEYFGPPPTTDVQVFEDRTREILARNDSPDVGFSWSVNPYRGCQHACAYCYARPYHEYLSFGAGTDHDTKIVVKPDAPALLRRAFDRPAWRGELVAFSGVTDCYQPLEAAWRLTRGCLEVCVEYRNPVTVVTKAPLVERDLDVLEELHRVASAQVSITLPFFDAATARALEPWAATPGRRLRTIEAIARRGIPVGVNVAPIIPALNDAQIADVLGAARDAGATSAAYVLLRLPGSVKAVFEERLRAALPLRAEHVLSRLRDTHGGALYDARFTTRQRGEGEYAATIAALFETTSRRLGLDRDFTCEGGATFRRPPPARGQLTLF